MGQWLHMSNIATYHGPQFHRIQWLAHSYPEPSGAKTPNACISWATCILSSLFTRCPSSNRTPSAQQKRAVGFESSLHRSYQPVVRLCPGLCSPTRRSKLDNPEFHPHRKGTALLNFLTSLKRRMANIMSPDKNSGRMLRSHWDKSEGVSWSSYFPLFSRKNTAESYTGHLESLGDVLGAWTEGSAPAAHLRSTWYSNDKFKNSNKCSSQHDHAFAWRARPVGPWIVYLGAAGSRSQPVWVESKVSMDAREIRESKGTWDSCWPQKYWAHSAPKQYPLS